MCHDGNNDTCVLRCVHDCVCGPYMPVQPMSLMGEYGTCCQAPNKFMDTKNALVVINSTE